MRHLGVWWWDGDHVADIEDRRGAVALRYSDEARDRWPANAPVVSCSLPLSPRWLDATPFLRGVLPEGRHLDRMAADAGLAVTDTIGLLARYGRDVAGALVIAEEWPGERPGSAIPYDEQSLAAEVAGMEDRPLGIHDDSELSIAGIQNKLLLISDGLGGWARPAGGAPSTHILKADDARHPGLIMAEAASMQLARRLGLTNVDTRLEKIGGVDCMIVSRFDRVRDDSQTARVHQEDVCQALGHDPADQRGRGKYEDAGGPSLAEVAHLLDIHARDPLTELDRLVAAITFTVLIGNADAHGKNLAFLHVNGTNIELAPLYDVVPTVLWPSLRREPAMSIGPRITTIDEITTADILGEVKTWSYEVNRAAPSVSHIARQALDAVSQGLVPHDDLSQLVATNAKRLLADLR